MQKDRGFYGSNEQQGDSFVSQDLLGRADTIWSKINAYDKAQKLHPRKVHKFRRSTLEEIFEEIETFFRYSSSLEVEVTPRFVNYRGAPVCTGDTGDHMTFRMHKGGVGKLGFYRGMTKEELKRFLDLLISTQEEADSNTSKLEEDFATLLWAEDFIGIDFAPAEEPEAYSGRQRVLDRRPQPREDVLALFQDVDEGRSPGKKKEASIGGSAMDFDDLPPAPPPKKKGGALDFDDLPPAPSPETKKALDFDDLPPAPAPEKKKEDEDAEKDEGNKDALDFDDLPPAPAPDKKKEDEDTEKDEGNKDALDFDDLPPAPAPDKKKEDEDAEEDEGNKGALDLDDLPPAPAPGKKAEKKEEGGSALDFDDLPPAPPPKKQDSEGVEAEAAATAEAEEGPRELPAVEQLTDVDEVALEQLLEFEKEYEFFKDFVSILLEILSQEVLEAVLDEVSEIVTQVVRILLDKRRYREASSVLMEIRGALVKRKDLTPVQRKKMEGVFTELSDRNAIRDLITSLRQARGREVKELKRYASNMPVETAPIFLQLVTSDRYEDLLDIVVRVARENAEPLLEGLQSSRPLVVKATIDVLREMHYREADVMVRPLRDHSSNDVRIAVFHFLHKVSGDPELEVQNLIRQALEEQDGRFLVKALGEIPDGSMGAFPVLRDHVTSKAFLKRSFLEKQTILRALCRSGPAQAPAVIEKTFFRGVILRRGKAREEARRCAAAALGELGNAVAVQVLKRHTSSWNRTVKEACRAAVAKIEGGRPK